MFLNNEGTIYMASKVILNDFLLSLRKEGEGAGQGGESCRIIFVIYLIISVSFGW